MRSTLNIDIFPQETANFVTHKWLELKQKAVILLGWEVIYLSSELQEQWGIERGTSKNDEATEGAATYVHKIPQILGWP